MISYIKRYKNHVVYFSILFCIGFFLGIIIALKNITFLEEHVYYYVLNVNNVQYNYILYHFFILVSLFFLAFVFIGPLLSSSVYFCEGMSIGFTMVLFSYAFGFKGFIYACLFILVTKGIYIISLLVFNIKCFVITSNKIKKRLLKNDYCVPNNIISKGAIVCFVVIIIYDSILLMFGANILGLFKFLIM